MSAWGGEGKNHPIFNRVGVVREKEGVLPHIRGGKIITFMHVGRGLMKPTHQSCRYTYVHGTLLGWVLCYNEDRGGNIP